MPAALCGWLSGCEAPPPIPETLDHEASYRLLFNGEPVGDALFTLQLEDGNYRIDAFSVPAGKMAHANGHEVLESSRGQAGAAGIRPLRFHHSVREDDRFALLDLAFDWERRRLTLTRGDEVRTLALLPGTHDRLSYLLAGRELARAGEGLLALQVAGPDATEETVLEVTTSEDLDLPAAHYRAVKIRRVTPEQDETRALWYALAQCPLPVKVLHETTDSTVEMVLQRCVQTGGLSPDPSPGPNGLR